MPRKYQPVKFALQNYLYLKNLNFADSRTRSGEIDRTIDSDYLWKFVSGKLKCGIGDEPRGIGKVFGYALCDFFVNVEGIKMNHQNQSSITTSHISLTLERSHFDYFDDVMKKVAILMGHPGGCITTVGMKLAIITVHLRRII